MLDHDPVTVDGMFTLQSLEPKRLEPLYELIVSGDLKEGGAGGDGTDMLQGGFQKKFPVASTTSTG